MSGQWIDLAPENLDTEHLCCAIADKKHRCGVIQKKAWIKERFPEGHVFRKLDAKGKVFIEYAPLETAWVPVCGENYLYIYCLWVSGSFQGHGYAKELLQSCIDDAKALGKSGVCALSAKNKKPYLSDKKFLRKHGFQVVDSAGDYELMALSFDSTRPAFAEQVKAPGVERKELTIYYSPQCPFVANCVEQVSAYCASNRIPLSLEPVDSLEKAKALPCVFNNWAVFLNGIFVGVQLLNEGALKKLLSI